MEKSLWLIWVFHKIINDIVKSLKTAISPSPWKKQKLWICKYFHFKSLRLMDGGCPLLHWKVHCLCMCTGSFKFLLYSCTSCILDHEGFQKVVMMSQILLVITRLIVRFKQRNFPPSADEVSNAKWSNNKQNIFLKGGRGTLAALRSNTRYS